MWVQRRRPRDWLERHGEPVVLHPLHPIALSDAYMQNDTMNMNIKFNLCNSLPKVHNSLI